MFLIPQQFLPDGRIAASLDRRMRAQLRKSLAHVAQQAAGYDLLPDGFETALQTIGGPAPVHPAAFAAYYRAVEAIFEDDLAAARAHLAFLVQEAHPVPAPDWADLTGPSPLGTLLDYYDRCFDTDPRTRFGITVPTPADAASGRANIEAGLALLAAAAPDIAAEFDALVHQIIMVADIPDDLGYAFDGGSSYQLWGALAVNVARPKSRVAMAVTLAHEATHSFLFGHTIEMALVRNDPGALYQSPLRADPRPMDGIYHATFVAARMHLAASALAALPDLDTAEQDEALALREAGAQAFESGIAVVDDKGDLSATGHALMSTARAYMADV